jgi:two-component system chemotaxis response regulator CheB
MTAEKLKSIKAIAIGGSAGGIKALLRILAPLPASFQLPIIVTLHVPKERDSKLAEVFQHHVKMTVRQAQDKEWIKPGIVYFAGSGYHLSVEKNFSFSLSCEEPKSFARPSIDIMMQSAADTYGDSLIGIVLTGANHDGAAGLASITAAGGLSVVQDPKEAETSIMPQAAINFCQPDLILTLDEIHRLLATLENNYDQ